NVQANIDSGATFIGFKDYPVHALIAGDGLISKFLLNRFTFDPSVRYVGRRVSHLYQGRAFLSKNEISTGQSGRYLLLYNEYQCQWNFWRDRIQTVSGAAVTHNYADAGATFHGRGKQIGVYSQIKFKPAPRLTLVAGVRYQYEDVFNVDTLFNVKFREGLSIPVRRTVEVSTSGRTTTYGDSTLLVLPPRRKVTMNEPIFRAGANYRLGRATYLRASFGQALRSPSVGERFTNTLAGPLQVLPNPFIEVERGWTAEIGARQLYRTADEKFIGFFDAAVFHMQFNRMVEFWADVEHILENASLASPNIAFKAQNISNVTITGVEPTLHSEIKLGPKLVLALGGGLTYIHPIDREGKKSWDGDDSTDVLVQKVVPILLGARDRSVVGFQDRPYTLKYRSKLLCRFNAEIAFESFSFSVNYRYTSPIVNVDKYLLIDLYEHMPTLKKAFGAALGLPPEAALALPDELVKNFMAANGIPRLFPDTRAYRRAHPSGWHEFDFVVSHRFRFGTFSFHVFNAFNAEFMTLPGTMGPQRSFAVQYKVEF
ncbi:MAG: TonB-dependent receptor, partial [Bacteroidia bacterium]|nr:TonB-dependent receptor [Bacteroidia bacterium]